LKLVINGVVSEVRDNISLQELIFSKNLKGDNLIVDVNGVIIKTDWDKVLLNSNDCIELVQMVFGG
jgi:thiamine biosynthesis protein ThiS